MQAGKLQSKPFNWDVVSSHDEYLCNWTPNVENFERKNRVYVSLWN